MAWLPPTRRLPTRVNATIITRWRATTIEVSSEVFVVVTRSTKKDAGRKLLIKPAPSNPKCSCIGNDWILVTVNTRNVRPGRDASRELHSATSEADYYRINRVFRKVCHADDLGREDVTCREHFYWLRFAASQKSEHSTDDSCV